VVSGVRRIGKLLLVDVDGDGPVVGLRFGMSGRLLVDGTAGVSDLSYAGNRELEAWDRFVVVFDDGGDLRMRDPRRLGGVELDPEEARLGPDALTVTPSGLARALGASTAPLKARLMEQSRLAGVGNLAADELLWRAGLDPARPAGSLSPAEMRRLHRHVRSTMADLLARGGSHTGDLMAARHPGGVCPKDGTPLARRTVGGRTTFSCPRHQV
jgi:formamidopyrimidine-DNA glycosylase